jgi:glycosyltransferase involved in cell wall biosynthesis
MTNYSNVAVLIPCHNEAETIRQVVSGFKGSLPQASVYVYDNCSTDDTKSVAENAGAIVKTEERIGKGNVVRRMFSDIDADYYIIVDGDLTYDPIVAPKMLSCLINDNLDMLNIARIGSKDSYRSGHRLGNFLLTKTVQVIFGSGLDDMLSGYRVFSRRFVKTFPAKSNGFEIETEFTVHSLEMKIPFGESSANYIDRPNGSDSKLSTYTDGIKILFMISKLFFLVKPITSFSILSSLFAISSIFIAWFQVFKPLLYFGEISKYPSVILSSSLMVLAIFLFMSGIIINSISNMRKDQFRLMYLNIKKNRHFS